MPVRAEAGGNPSDRASATPPSTPIASPRPPTTLDPHGSASVRVSPLAVSVSAPGRHRGNRSSGLTGCHPPQGCAMRPCLQPHPCPPACREVADYGLNASQLAADAAHVHSKLLGAPKEDMRQEFSSLSRNPVSSGPMRRRLKHTMAVGILLLVPASGCSSQSHRGDDVHHGVRVVGDDQQPDCDRQSSSRLKTPGLQ